MRNDALHAEVLANPDDDGPRLVYADWLLAHGDPRGEFIQAQVLSKSASDPEQREAARWRAQVLLSRHGEAWGLVSRRVRTVVERGFIQAIKGVPDAVVDELDTLLDWACVEKLDLQSGLTPGALEEVVKHVDRMALKALIFDRCVLSQPALETLAGSQGLSSLLEIFAVSCAIVPDGLAALCGSPSLANVVQLWIGGQPLSLRAIEEVPPDAYEGIDGPTLRALCRWPQTNALWSLKLSHNRFGPGDFAAVVRRVPLPNLRELDLRESGCGIEDIWALAEAGVPLKRLCLAENQIGPELGSVIAESHCLAGLELLDLAHTNLSAEGLDALMDSAYLNPQLDLVLDGDLFGLPVLCSGLGEPSWAGTIPAAVRACFPNVRLGGRPGGSW